MYPVISNNKSVSIHNITREYKPTFTSKNNGLSIDTVEKVNHVSPTEKPTKMLLSLLKSSLTNGDVNMTSFEGANYHDWNKLLEIANESSVTAIATESLDKSPKGTVPTDIAIKMYEVQKESETKHTLQEKILGELSEKFNKEGIETVQLKGVGLSMNYPNPNHRFGGDIDIFTRMKGTVTENRSNSSDIVDNMMISEGRHIDDYNLPKVKHSEFEYDGVRIENHRYFVNKERFVEAKKIDAFLHKALNPREQILPNGTKILVPSKEFNTVFLAQHAFQHYILGGIDIHHLTDWATHLQSNGMEFPGELKGTRLEEFTNAFTNLSNKYLGTKIKAPENKEYEEKLLQILLNPKSDSMPENLNNLEVVLFKTRRLIKKAKHAREYGGRNIAKVLVQTALDKLKDPAVILRRV